MSTAIFPAASSNVMGVDTREGETAEATIHSMCGTSSHAKGVGSAFVTTARAVVLKGTSGENMMINEKRIERSRTTRRGTNFHEQTRTTRRGSNSLEQREEDRTFTNNEKMNSRWDRLGAQKISLREMRKRFKWHKIGLVSYEHTKAYELRRGVRTLSRTQNLRAGRALDL
jgi:hypothetical protein